MEPSRNFTESVSRAFSILSVLSEDPSPLSLTELAHKLHLSKSTIQRLTYTLQHLGYLDREDATKKYHLGPKVFSLGLFVMKNLDLRKLAFPYMEELSNNIGEIVNLSILNGTEIVYLARTETQHILNINLHVGSRRPAYCTSMGKLLLAFLPEGQLEDYLTKVELNPLTPHTITSTEILREELKKIKVQGFAIANEESSIGLRSVAAPLKNFTGETVAAINIGVPSVRISLKKLRTILAKQVIETADRISVVLGYR
jgi:IclR family pca regulon transcriptional regulator